MAGEQTKFTPNVGGELELVEKFVYFSNVTMSSYEEVVSGYKSNVTMSSYEEVVSGYKNKLSKKVL